ncbi:TIM barrel protein [Burkholderia sp. BCC0419]|uniref:hydroxypyruvate isomerase family protein n=1 Tax=Burkholderia sp. BCC0419 TaxID=486878 RepID=UPI00158837D4|nr:TIM barrel protein [Burkholderia sp. BCC0419]
MPNFSANLTLLFNELPFLDRFEAAAAAGFKAVEFYFPYDYRHTDLRRLLRDNGLKLVVHSLPSGDWAKGERGIACQIGSMSSVRASRAASTMPVHWSVHAAGIRSPAFPVDEPFRVLTDNLCFAAEQLAEAGLELVVEQVNSRDVPGFLLDRPETALAIVREVGAPNVKLQYDVYQAQVLAGDLTRFVEAHIDHIGHIQIADNPGRHEPGTGEINYDFFLRRIAEIGYSGWVGCEYVPLSTTTAGLDWLRRTTAHLNTPALFGGSK